MDITKKIYTLLLEGYRIGNEEYPVLRKCDNRFPCFLTPSKYELWIKDIRLLADRYLKEHPLYLNIMGCSKSYDDKAMLSDRHDHMMEYLWELSTDETLNSCNTSWKTENRKTKIFISHASSDIFYVKHFVRMVESLNIDNIFCSSFREYGIPIGVDIYQHIKKEFSDNELLVVYMLSDNYYKSAACLNEMGAAWICQSEYYSFLLPKFNFNEIKGAINPNKIGIKLEALDLKSSLNELKDNLCSKFNVTVNPDKWERYRNDFIESVQDDVPIDVTKTFENRTVSIQSLVYNKYLGADKDQDDTPIFVHLDIRGNWELFEVEIMQDGWAAFKACNNGKYISARDDKYGTPLFACADTVQDWECFKIFLHNGKHLLKARVNNKYIMADIDHSITPGAVGLYAYVYKAQEWEQFQIKIVR